MENVEDTLLPYILELLSRSPDMTARVQDIEKAVKQAIKDGTVTLKCKFRAHFNEAFSNALELGLVTVSARRPKKKRKVKGRVQCGTKRRMPIRPSAKPLYAARVNICKRAGTKPKFRRPTQKKKQIRNAKNKKKATS